MVLEAYDLTQIQSYGEVEDKDRPVLEAYDLTWVQSNTKRKFSSV